MIAYSHQAVIDGLSARLRDEPLHSLHHGMLTFTVSSEQLHDTLLYLRDDLRCQCTALMDIFSVDHPSRHARFSLIYHLLSITLNARIAVTLAVKENAPVPSVTSLFPTATWLEREIWDMMGIPFTHHPDLRRILTDYGFKGHPLRKDFPLSGYEEVRYDSATQKVIYEPLVLPQQFREFDFTSPWEGTDYVLPGDEKAKGTAHG